MGEVWAARNERTGSDCAVKLLLGSLARCGEAVARFERETRATGQLEHPGIVRVYDAGELGDGRPYLVLELLRGESLDARLKREGRLEAVEVCRVLGLTARALAHAHEAGVVHRDLSAANVFLVRDARKGPPGVKILDFGVSKLLQVAEGERRARRLTGNGSVLGSPEYMSPEQAAGAAGVDARTDVWALGVQAYECLTGTTPFRGSNYNAQIVSIVNQPHRPLRELVPDLDRELVDLVERCLRKNRDERVQSASELAARFEDIGLRLLGEQERSHPDFGRRRSDVPARRAPGWLRAVGSLALAGAGIGLGLWGGAWWMLQAQTPNLERMTVQVPAEALLLKSPQGVIDDEPVVVPVEAEDELEEAPTSKPRRKLPIRRTPPSRKRTPPPAPEPEPEAPKEKPARMVSLPTRDDLPPRPNPY